MEYNPVSPILIVDDDLEDLNSQKLLLFSIGFNNIKLCSDSRDVNEFLKDNNVSVILLDLQMPHRSGKEVLKDVKENYPDIPIIMVTGSDDVETAIQCMKLGAYDFFLKPIKTEVFEPAVKRAIEIRALQQENERLRTRILNQKIKSNDAFAEIITDNKQMYSIFQYVEVISISNEPVLINGECGVGKESIARAVHSLSGREGEFVAVNIAGLDDTLFSDVLFGHKKGAFTGADKARKGLVEKAYGGTLFLDEIGDLSFASQVKLLRLLQEKEYCPLGSDTPVRSNVHIVAATNKDLKQMAADKEFRNDLYYRLAIHSINIPPLRERMDDLILLTDFFIEDAAAKYNKKKPELSGEIIDLLNHYAFPGNIRQLRSIIFDAVCRSEKNKLSLEAVKSRLTEDAAGAAREIPAGHIQNNSPSILFPGRLPTIKETREVLIKEALVRSHNKKNLAANMLGISRQALSEWLLKNKR